VKFLAAIPVAQTRRLPQFARGQAAVRRRRAAISTTLLAANGVSREVRARLQSHRVTGVRALHHDGKDQIDEPPHAIEAMVNAVREATALAAQIDSGVLLSAALRSGPARGVTVQQSSARPSQ
jgi:hypothetical protein